MANIKDVAKLANVSVATVSRVINEKGYVHEKTKEQVLDAIKSLNYLPNEVARSLYRKSTNSIGVLIPALNNEFYNTMITEMDQVILEHGYNMMLCMTKDDAAREKDYLRLLATSKVSGLIICANLINIEYYQSLAIPAVSLEHNICPTIPSVTANNLMGGKIAARELLKRGCQNIVQFRGPSNITSSRQRSQGFLQELRNFPHIKVHNVDTDFLDDLSDNISVFLSTRPEIDGIFTVSDHIAAKVMRCLNDLNKRVPQDVQLIGYDNLSICENSIPSLSTIAQPMYDMGSLTATLLFKLLAGEKPENLHVELPVKFILRESTSTL